MSSSGNLQRPEGNRLVYRFVCEQELNAYLNRKDLNLNGMDGQQRGQKTIRDENSLRTRMETLMLQGGRDEYGDEVPFGQMIAECTMTTGETKSKGNISGANAYFICTTDDIEKLVGSKCDQVKKIVKSAPYIVTFEMPKSAVVAGASELSGSEGEHLIPNMQSEVATTLIDYCPNPYLKKE